MRIIVFGYALSVVVLGFAVLDWGIGTARKNIRGLAR